MSELLELSSAARSSMGIEHRMARIFNSTTGAAVIVPFDDVLISGPDHVGGGDPDAAIEQTLQAQPDAIVGFHTFSLHTDLGRTAFICNTTLSFEGADHTRKFVVDDTSTALLTAVRADAAAIAVHVNCQSHYSEEQFDALRRLSTEAKSWGMPTIGFLYARGKRPDGTDENFTELRKNDPMAYARLACKGIRRGVDLGVDAIKTQWTGTAESFAIIVEAAQGRPVVIAGGPRADTHDVLQMAFDACQAGANGTSFGRNVFNNENPGAMTSALMAIVHQRQSVDEAMALMTEPL